MIHTLPGIGSFSVGRNDAQWGYLAQSVDRQSGSGQSLYSFPAIP